MRAAWQRGGRLRFELPSHLFGLHAPAWRRIFEALQYFIRRVPCLLRNSCCIERTGARSEIGDVATEVQRRGIGRHTWAKDQRRRHRT